MASLSALGAGALVFGASRAEAGIIYSGILDAQMGFTSGSVTYKSPKLGASDASFAFWQNSRSGFGYSTRQIRAYGYGLAMAKQSGLIQLFNLGARWSPGLAADSSMLVGGRTWGTRPILSSTFVSGTGHGSFQNRFALFKFDQGGQTLFGWMQLSFSVSSQFGADPAFGPELTIHDFAYDDSGALIDAGQTTATVPEPSTAVSTGLAALALGAAGLRSWRRNRKAA
jgi:hypothetical protein